MSVSSVSPMNKKKNQKEEGVFREVSMPVLERPLAVS